MSLYLCLSLLSSLSGWWSYEFCYGREVKQYHFENGAIQGETISLGKFESDYDWSKTEAWEASAASAKEASAWEASTKAKAKKRKHHSQYYVDGSKCDLTGEPRKTEVRFKCDESLKGSGVCVCVRRFPSWRATRTDSTYICVCLHAFLRARVCACVYDGEGRGDVIGATNLV